MKHRAGFYLRLVGTLAWYAGLLLLCASPVRAEVRYVYDEVGRLIQVTNPAGESAYYHYDAAGNLLSITRSTVGELAIAEVTPDQGVVGTRVTIAGAGFSTAVSANRVTFNGVSATVLSATATTLVTTVPQGASTGGLTVTIGAQTVSSATRFTVTSTALDAAPTIGSFLPQIALPGALVSIVGKHFARPPGNNIVSFNLTQAPVDSGTTGRLNTTVPTGATSGPLKVRTPTGTALSSTDFFVVPAGFTASQVSVAQRLKVNGPPLAIDTASPGKIALVLFHGTQGQYLGLSFTPVTVTGGNGQLTLKTPSGANVVAALPFNRAFSHDLPQLPETGSYTLFIRPSASAVLQTTITLSEDATSSIAADGKEHLFNPTRVGQNARYHYSGKAGQHLSLVLRGDTFQGSTRVLVYQPNGSQVLGTSLFYGGDLSPTQALNLPTLPVTGLYTIVVSPQGTTTGSLSTILWADATGVLAVNGAATAVDLPLGRDGRYTFVGGVGQRLGLGLTQLSTTPAGRSVVVRVHRPDGTVLKDCAVVRGSGDSCDLPPLPIKGTYTVLVDNEEWATTCQLWLSADITDTVPLNGPALTFSSTRVGQNAQYRFVGSQGQSLLLLSGDTFAGLTLVSVFKPDGRQMAATSLFYSSGPGSSRTLSLNNLPATGTYTIFLTPQGLATGAINTRLTMP